MIFVVVVGDDLVCTCQSRNVFKFKVLFLGKLHRLGCWQMVIQ